MLSSALAGGSDAAEAGVNGINSGTFAGAGAGAAAGSGAITTGTGAGVGAGAAGVTGSLARGASTVVSPVNGFLYSDCAVMTSSDDGL